MPAWLQEEWGGEIACLRAPQEVALRAELKPPRSEKEPGEAGWQGGRMQRRVKLSSAHIRLRAEMRLERSACWIKLVGAAALPRISGIPQS